MGVLTHLSRCTCSGRIVVYRRTPACSARSPSTFGRLMTPNKHSIDIFYHKLCVTAGSTYIAPFEEWAMKLATSQPTNNFKTRLKVHVHSHTSLTYVRWRRRRRPRERKSRIRNHRCKTTSTNINSYTKSTFCFAKDVRLRESWSELLPRLDEYGPSTYLMSIRESSRVRTCPRGRTLSSPRFRRTRRTFRAGADECTTCRCPGRT